MINKTLLLLCLSATLSGVSFTDYGDDWKTQMSFEAQQFLAFKIVQEKLWNEANEATRQDELTDQHRVESGIRIVFYPVQDTKEYQASHFTTIFGRIKLFPDKSTVSIASREAAVKKVLNITSAQLTNESDGCHWVPKKVYELTRVDHDCPLPMLKKSKPKDCETTYEQITAFEEEKKRLALEWKRLSDEYKSCTGTFSNKGNT
jgi:hypothetical protein